MINSELICKKMRKNILDMTKSTGSTGAHIGGALSLVEIMYSIYFDSFDYRSNHIILSKGHGIMAQYAAFEQLGLLKENELFTFKNNDTRLYAHPTLGTGLPIEFASGSLGQGLSLGVGEALADKMNGGKERTIVILGDGECDEGQIWEAAMAASHFSLNNLVAIIDFNKIQYDGKTEGIMNLDPFIEKWESFGWKVLSVDGHSVSQLNQAFKTIDNNRPLAIVANTVKGKGVSFIENNPVWHNHALSDEQYKMALEEIGIC